VLAINGGIPVRTKPWPDWPVHGELEERLVLEAVRSGRWGGVAHDKIAELETAFADLQQAKHAIAVTNGTMAITVALKAVGVEPGDEVIMPPYTFIATASAALLFGAIPVFADVQEGTMLLDPERVEAAITPRTKAILAVHIGGASADMDRLRAIAAKHKLRLVEDAAQAAGAAWQGRGVGAIGDIGTFSFQSSKNVTAGEGGMIVTNDDAIADMAWSIANVGRVRGGAWYGHANIGWNLRMTELQAALALAQLTRLETQMQRRESNARLLSQLLVQIEGIGCMDRHPGVTRHAYHLFMFTLNGPYAGEASKQEIIARLNAEGIPVTHGYPSLNRNDAIVREVDKLRGGGKPAAECPVSESMSGGRLLWLHQNVLLADEEAMYEIATGVRKVMESFR